MKVLAWDDGLLGSREDNNIVRELHSITPYYFAVKMKDGKIWQYNNAASIDSMYCPKCKQKIQEDCIGRENYNTKEGYSCFCKECNLDIILEDALTHYETLVEMT